MASSDPLDTPPVDHGSDRGDYVEIQAPDGIRPIGEWWDKILRQPCVGCRANVFAKFVFGVEEVDRMWDASAWHITYAHDDNCPVLLVDGE